MPDFKRRFSGPEMMDDPDADESMLEAALVELPRINTFLGGYRATLATLEAYRRCRRPSTLRILDVGTGIADYPLRMVRWGLAKGVDVRVTASDVNPRTIDFARKAVARQPQHVRARIDFVVADALELGLPPKSFDVCTSALFLHHLSREECVSSIRQMLKTASAGIIVNDIHRHRLAYHGIFLVTRIFPFSEMVRHDAPVSVLRAFRRAELEDTAREAGLD
ncbi:MAG: methyltransferase domain-containing protein, partial [Rhodothermales bacterium]|nr:methyltransferase domain-containing protein [Rhodothermales bacterium]